jgi:UDP-glucose 4-epimerase
MVYGPGQRDVRKLIPYVTTSLLRGHAPKLSSGTRKVDWVYVEDVARDLALAAITPGIEGKTIDIGTGVLTPVGTVAQKLGQIMRSEIAPVIGQVADRPDEQIVAADVNARHKLLGDAQVTQLDEGLSRTIDWYRAAIESGEIRIAD